MLVPVGAVGHGAASDCIDGCLSRKHWNCALLFIWVFICLHWDGGIYGTRACFLVHVVVARKLLVDLIRHLVIPTNWSVVKWASRTIESIEIITFQLLSLIQMSIVIVIHLWIELGVSGRVLLRRSHALLRLVDLHALSLLDYMSCLYKPILVTRLQHLLDQTLPLRLLLNDINVQGWHSIVDSCRGNI